MSSKGSALAQVKELRERTGAGIVDCQRALTESGGDVEKAIVFLSSRNFCISLRVNEDNTRSPKAPMTCRVMLSVLDSLVTRFHFRR